MRATSSSGISRSLAISSATQKPFSVVLSVEQNTQIWLSVLAVGVVVALVYLKK